MARPLPTVAIVAITLVTCATLLAAAGYVLMRFTDVRIPFISDTCRAYADGDHVQLEPEQLTHAATIAAAGTMSRVGERGVAIALATALQESKLRNLSHGDRDSLGLFQQRPSQGWGTAEQLQDPHYASTIFFSRLRKIPNWRELAIADAAQAVQHSAHPSAYAKWSTEATTLAGALAGKQTRAVTCQLREQLDSHGQTNVEQLRNALQRDYGGLNLHLIQGNELRLSLDLSGGKNSSSLPPGGPVTGWHLAHWFVAKSRDYGVQQVAFDGAAWSASSGKWESNKSARPGQLTLRLSD
ncbi:MAG: hypothetical protein DLM55_01570 [Acidimicrobiales bacterium]|nr:MAG: hypothetical protein DLM55_01570 [Acidimicrobiales bacterium]